MRRTAFALLADAHLRGRALPPMRGRRVPRLRRLARRLRMRNLRPHRARGLPVRGRGDDMTLRVASLFSGMGCSGAPEVRQRARQEVSIVQRPTEEVAARAKDAADSACLVVVVNSSARLRKNDPADCAGAALVRQHLIDLLRQQPVPAPVVLASARLRGRRAPHLVARVEAGAAVGVPASLACAVELVFVLLFAALGAQLGCEHGSILWGIQ